MKVTPRFTTTPTNSYPDHQVVLLCLSEALHNKDGFAKVLVGDDEIFGCHVIGLETLILIHKVSTAVGGADAPISQRRFTSTSTVGGHPGTLRNGQDVTSAGI